MNQYSVKSRHWTFCFLLTLVLFLGLVQWSFLPLLIDSGMPASSAVMTMAAGHSSKFAAPYKHWVGTSLGQYVRQPIGSVPMFTPRLIQPVEELVSSRDDRFLTHSLLRAPPSL